MITDVEAGTDILRLKKPVMSGIIGTLEVVLETLRLLDSGSIELRSAVPRKLELEAEVEALAELDSELEKLE